MNIGAKDILISIGCGFFLFTTLFVLGDFIYQDIHFESEITGIEYYNSSSGGLFSTSSSKCVLSFSNGMVLDLYKSDVMFVPRTNISANFSYHVPYFLGERKLFVSE